MLQNISNIRITFICALYILFGITNSYTQENFSFTKLSSDKGITQSIIYSISQDTVGNIWMASEEGVFRYNSINSEFFNKYKGFPEDYSSRVETIFINQNNEIWVGNQDGLAFFDSSSNSFTKISNSNDLNPSLVKSITADEHGLIWVAAFNGLWRLDFENSKEFQLERIIDSPNFQTVHSLNGKILAGSNTSLYLINDSGKEVEKLEQIGGEYYITNIAEYQGNYFIGTRNDGLIILNSEFQFIEKAGLPKEVNNYPIFDLIYHDQKFYIATDGAGLVITDPKLKEFQIFQNDPNNPQSLSSNGIYDIHIDQENILWVATYGGGVNYVNPQKNQFTIFKHIINEPNSLIDNFIRSIAEDRFGRIWFGTKKGISIWDAEKKSWQHLSNFGNGSKPLPEIILSMEPTDEAMWVGTYNDGAYKISLDNFSIKHYNPEVLNGFTLNKIYSIHEDQDKSVWFGGIEGDLMKLTPNDEILIYNIAQVKTISTSHSGDVLIAGRHGVHKIDREGNITHLDTLAPGNNRYHYITVNTLQEYKNDFLLLGTNGAGILFYDQNTEQISALNAENGMPSDIIQGILISEDDNIWASTAAGLVRASMTENDTVLYLYDEADGLADNEFNYGSYAELSGNKFAFGSVNGATIFSPSNISEDVRRPKVYIETFSLDNSEIEAGEGPLSTSINATKKIQLRHNQNSFAFDFAGVLHQGSSQVKYSWKLEGFDKDWTPPTLENTAIYTNISPGDYTLKVRAANRLGEWGETRRIDLKVNSPWYASPVAFVIYFLLLIGIFVFVIYITTAFVNKKNAENQVNFYNNLTHEIRTPLTILLSSLEDSTDGTEKDTSNKIKSTVRRINSLFKQMLSYQKSTHDEEKTEVHALRPGYQIEELANDFQPLLKDKALRLDIKNTWKDELFYCNKESFEKILFNLISNSIKYSFKGGEICIRSSKGPKKMLKLEVIDNGMGIPKDQQKNIMKTFYRARNVVNSQHPGTGLGLMLVNNIVERNGGSISFHSEENKGTTFTVLLNNRTAEFKESSILKESSAKKLDIHQSARLAEFSDSKLLIVEDNEELRKELERILGKYFQVYEAKNGKRGLEKASQIYPDIIITDLIMPEMDGLEMSKIIKEDINLNHIPIFMLTVLRNRNQKLESLENGVSEYLEKPIDINLLFLKILNALVWQKKLQEKYKQDSELETAVRFRNESDETFIREIEAYILKEIKDNSFSVHDLCGHFNMSRTSLYMKLKNLIDLSPQDLIINTRLKYSKKLLITTRMNIKEIAYSSGFSNPKYFSTSFKKFYKQTPSQLRNKIKQSV